MEDFWECLTKGEPLCFQSDNQDRHLTLRCVKNVGDGVSLWNFVYKTIEGDVTNCVDAGRVLLYKNPGRATFKTSYAPFDSSTYYFREIHKIFFPDDVLEPFLPCLFDLVFHSIHTPSQRFIFPYDGCILRTNHKHRNVEDIHEEYR